MADLGVQAPLYAGAASKVLLAGMEDDEIEAYLGRTDLTAFQESTITDRNVLWREIRIIRKRDFRRKQGQAIRRRWRARSANQGFFRTDRRGEPEHRYTAEHREHCIGLLLWRSARTRTPAGRSPTRSRC
jgi:hypothetical protein